MLLRLSMGKGKPKQVAAPVVPNRKAAPSTARAALPDAATSAKRICWRFTHVDHGGPWGFGQVTPGTLCWILECLGRFETMTTDEIFHNGGHPGKDYDVADLPTKQARTRLEHIGLADQTKIWRLRLNGPSRLYGFLDGNVFHVVWWDPEHRIWPSKKR